MTIKTISQVLFFRKEKIQPLTEFDSIKISPQTESIEEGYLKILYSLVLSGPTNSKEIVILTNRTGAKVHLEELAMFLKLRAEDIVL